MPIDPTPTTTKTRLAVRESLNIAFEVPFVHRLRLTTDVVGEDFSLLEDLIDLDAGPSGSAKVLLWVDAQVDAAAGYGQRLGKRLTDSPVADLLAPPLIIEGGEAVKNSDVAVQTMLRQINDNNLDRRSYIIAVGGGAMLDASGYAAAIAHRGIRLIRLPSTVLGQADSGVGVKNAINFFGKKNWVGTFAVPWAVVNDVKLLESLPDRDYVSGFTEAVKVSLLKDEAIFRWLVDNADAIRDRETAKASRAIHESCVLHLRHITEGGDPFEMQEARPLDFGHWSAHRLEPLTNYTLRHGEAVGIGVAIDCLYSSLKFGFPREDADAVVDCLRRLGTPLWHDAIAPVDRLLTGLEEFRQHLGGRLTITMLRGVGDPINVHEIDHDVMRQAIEMLRSC